MGEAGRKVEKLNGDGYQLYGWWEIAGSSFACLEYELSKPPLVPLNTEDNVIYLGRARKADSESPKS
jgi:hypothetical protein